MLIASHADKVTCMHLIGEGHLFLSIKEESKLISRRWPWRALAPAGDECCGDNLGAGIPLKVSVETSALWEKHVAQEGGERKIAYTHFRGRELQLYISIPSDILLCAAAFFSSYACGPFVARRARMHAGTDTNMYLNNSFERFFSLDAGPRKCGIWRRAPRTNRICKGKTVSSRAARALCKWHNRSGREARRWIHCMRAAFLVHCMAFDHQLSIMRSCYSAANGWHCHDVPFWLKATLSRKIHFIRWKDATANYSRKF